jgi:hypothetical protein
MAFCFCFLASDVGHERPIPGASAIRIIQVQHNTLMEIAQLILEYIKTLIWPVFAFACLVLFRSSIAGLVPRLKNAELPGGLKFNFQEAIEQAQQLTKEILAAPKPPDAHPTVEKPVKQTETNARMIALGLQPSPSGLDLDYYRALIEQDPNIALAGLRMELEILGRNLAKGFNIPLSPGDNSVMRLFRKLLDSGAITGLQFQLLKIIIDLCNAAIHGQRVTKAQAESILDVMNLLADDYVEWLLWGFPEK